MGLLFPFPLTNIISVIFRILVRRLLKQACKYYVKFVRNKCRIFLSAMLMIGDSK